MPLSDIVDVTISIARAAVTAAGFGVPMILGTHTRFAERYRNYSTLAGMEADGFLTSDVEYQAAQSLLAGNTVPDTFVVGRRLAEVAQQLDITFAGDADGDYTVTLNGTAHLHTSSAQSLTQLIDSLVTLINAGAQAAVVTASNVGGTTLRVLSDVPGTPFTYSVASAGGASTMTPTLTTANQGVQEDLSQIRAAGAVWYGTMQTSRQVEETRLAAAWTESNDQPPTIFMAQTSEATSGSAALNPAGTDIANVLAALDYRRTGLWWKGDDAEYADAGIFGRELPVDPGKDMWGLKTLVGITPDSLSETYRTNLLAKNANIYYALTPSNNITYKGTMASGDWIDNVRFVDFLIARISEAIANMMLGNERITFDEPGLQMIRAQIAGVLQAAQDAGKISSYTIDVPAISAYSAEARAARQLDPPITFNAQLAGALIGIEINGTVTE